MATFQAADYAVFILVLVGTAAVGVVQGILTFIREKKEPEKSAEGGVSRDLSVWPASLSIMASVSAAPFVLGIPAEIYVYGTMFSMVVFGYIGLPIISHLIYGRFYDLGITSMYEYLELRFNIYLRRLATFLFAITMLIYSGVIVYAPALAFNQVSGVDINLCIVLVGIIGVVYTTVGGLKGVLWVDALQMLIILAGVLALVIKGSIDMGGFDKVWEIADRGQRIQFDQISADPKIRHTLWTQVIGGVFFTFVMFSNQGVLQKFLGLPSKTKMHITSYVSMVSIILYFILFTMAGLVTYAYYEGCDPISTGRVSQGDQLVPLVVLELFEHAPGFPGLFTAAVFGATLSSIAGAMNAMAAVELLDFIQPLMKKINPDNVQDTKKTFLIFKALVVLNGCLIVGIAFVTPHMGSSVIQLSLSIVGTFGGPITALFFLGMLCPWVNSWGAIAGCLTSLVLVSWMNFGAVITDVNDRVAIPLPLRTDECFFDSPSNDTLYLSVVDDSRSLLDDFYEVSYMWYSMIGVLVTVLVAFIFSAITGFRRGDPVDTRLSYRCCYNVKVEDQCFDEGEITKIPDYDHKINGLSYVHSPDYIPSASVRGIDNHSFVDHFDPKSGIRISKF